MVVDFECCLGDRRVMIDEERTTYVSGLGVGVKHTLVHLGS